MISDNEGAAFESPKFARGGAASDTGETSHIASLKPTKKLTADAVLPPPRANATLPPGLPPIVAIGASTGGTDALLEVLPKLPPTSPPIVIVQHMPVNFMPAFAKRLNDHCVIEVRQAVHRDQLLPGTALIAPGDRHMAVKRDGQGYRVEILDGPLVTRHRPSVDVLFRSVAIAAGPAGLGVLLTGMGDDGARCLLEMREAGAETIVQDAATSVVWGMPGEAVRRGAACRVVALDAVAGLVACHVGRRRRRGEQKPVA